MKSIRCAIAVACLLVLSFGSVLAQNAAGSKSDLATLRDRMSAEQLNAAEREVREFKPVKPTDAADADLGVSPARTRP